jgi:hypothetical protein
MTAVRWAFVLTLILALNPSFAEAAEMAVEYARTGVVTHEGSKHESSTGQTCPMHHHCGCCSHSPAADAEQPRSAGVMPAVSSWMRYESVPWADVVGPPLFRPPIR